MFFFIREFVLSTYDTYFEVVVSFDTSLLFSVVVFWLWLSSVIDCDSEELESLSSELALSDATVSSEIAGRSSSFWAGSSILAVVTCSVVDSGREVLDESADDSSWATWSERFLEP